MVSDFLRWVSKENFKNQKIVEILISSIKSMVPDHTFFEAFQMLKPDFISSSFIVKATNGLKFLDFEIKKKCPFADDVLFIQKFRLYANGAIVPAGISHFETKDGVFDFAIF